MTIPSYKLAGMTTQDRHLVRRWIQFACDCNGVPEFGQVIVVEWNPRFTRKMGDATYNPYTFRARVRLSVPLWPRASDQEKRQTVIHEVCHCIAVYKKHGRVRRPHGLEWQQAMQNCGIEPLPTHSVDRTGLARRQRRFVLLDCPNEHKCRLTVRHYNMIQAGCELECKNCDLVVDRTSPMVEERPASALKKL